MTAPADRPSLRDRCDQICDRVSVSSIASRYGVQFKRAGNEWKACCPFHEDRSPSFSIYEADRRWICFGCGAGGNVLDFAKRAYGIALIEAIEMLDDGTLPAANMAPKLSRKAQSHKDGIMAGRTWCASVAITDTLAERYIVEYRKLSLDGVARDDLRFHPECIFREDGELRPWPSLIVLFRDILTLEPVAIQRIRLDASGARARDASGEKLPKKTLGPTEGAAIMLSGPWTDTAYIGITEGPETAIALINAGERSVWALGGTSNIRRVPLLFDDYPLSLVVYADADQPGQDAARVATARYADAGRDALIISPSVDGFDFADLVE